MRALAALYRFLETLSLSTVLSPGAGNERKIGLSQNRLSQNRLSQNRLSQLTSPSSDCVLLNLLTFSS